MWKQAKTKHHNKHGQPSHRPQDAYQIYELEHMPHELVKLPSFHTNIHAQDASRPDYYETGRETQPHWRPPGHGHGIIFRPDYHETVQPYLRPQPEDDNGDISKENINTEAEKYILLEHEKFELSTWMSMNAK